MKKIIKYISLVALSTVICFRVYAQSVLDVSHIVGSNINKAADIGQNGWQKQLDMAAVKKSTKFIDAAKEGRRKIKKLKSQAQETVKATQDLKASVEQNIDQVKDGLAGAAYNLAASNAAVLSSLQAQQTQAKAEYEAKVQGYEATRDSTVKKHEENIKIYEKMKSEDSSKAKEMDEKINEAKKAIQKAQDDCSSQIENAKKEYEEKNSKYEQQINTLKAAAANTDPLSTDNLKNKATDKAKSLLGGDGNALNSSIAENFYAEDEQEDIERNKQINNYRRKTEFQDMMESYQQAIKVLAEGDKSKDYADDLKSEGPTTETAPAPVVVNATLLVEQMRSMMKYAKLQIAEMKIATARDMVKMPKRLSDYSTIMESNLDVYEQIGQGKLKKSGFSLNDAKKMYDKAKTGIDEAKSKYEEAKEVVSAAGELAGAVGAFGSSIGGDSGENNDASPSAQEENPSDVQNNIANVSQTGTASQNTSFVNSVKTPSVVPQKVPVNTGGNVAMYESGNISPITTKIAMPQSTRQAFSPIVAISNKDVTPLQRTDIPKVSSIQAESIQENENMPVLTKALIKTQGPKEIIEEDTKETETLSADDEEERQLISEKVLEGEETPKELSKENVEKGEIKQNENLKQAVKDKEPAVAEKKMMENKQITIGRKAFSQPMSEQKTDALGNQENMAVKQQERGQ